MITILFTTLQIDGPEEGKVLYWALGLLATGLGAALIYIKQIHKLQIEAKDTVIHQQEETITYEREEKEKSQKNYIELVKEFNSIFQQQNLIKNG